VRADGLAFAAILIPILISLRAAILQPGMMLTGHDISQQYNWEANTRHALSLGQTPLWNPFIFSGFPALADFQTAVLYPLYAVMRLLPLEQFLLWNAALHLWIAGIGTYLLCRELGASRLAATTAGVAFALSGALTPRILAGMLHFICGLAWIPWAVLYAMRSARRGGMSPHPGLVIVLAFQYLTGYVQIFVYTIAASVFCYLWIFLSERTEARALAIRAGMALLGVGIALGFVVGLVSVQLTSAMRLLPEMGRAAGIEYDAAARWAPDPRDVLTVMFPRAYAVPNREFQDSSGALLWEKADYVSLLLPVLSIVGIARGWRRNDVRMLVALGLLTYVVAMANALPLFRLHYVLLGGFRYPGRLLPVFSVAIAVLGAVGLDALLAWARNGMHAPRVRTAAAAIGAGLVGMGCLQPGGSENRWLSTVLGTPLWVVILSLVALVSLPLLARRFTATVVPGILAFFVISADMVSFAQAFVSVEKPPQHEQVVSALRDDGVGRVLSACEEGFSLYRPMSAVVPMVDGLNTAFLGDYAQFASIARDGRAASSFRQFPTVWLDTPRRLDLVDLMNVTHVVKCTPLNNERFQLVNQVSGLYIYRNRNALPRAQWMCAVDLVDTEQQVIDLLSDNGRNARQRVAVMRSEGLNDSPISECQPASAVETTVQDTPGGALSVQVQSTTPGILLLSEPFYSERRARVDGVAAPLLHANLAFTAVLLPAGTHRVDLDFSPDRLYLGIIISLITAALMIVLELRRQRRRVVA
jgi:hypothetical protein